MKIFIIVLSILIILVTGYYIYQSKKVMENNPSVSAPIFTQEDLNKNMNNIKTLIYEGITFTAPNTIGKGYYVFATKNGKVIWEKDKDTVTTESPNSPNKSIVTRFKIQNLKESDLDNSASDFQQMKAYIGKPALIIYSTQSNTPSESWEFVDINTGKLITFNGVN